MLAPSGDTNYNDTPLPPPPMNTPDINRELVSLSSLPDALNRYVYSVATFRFWSVR